MGHPHAQPGEAVAVRSQETAPQALRSRLLLKTERAEIIRMELPAGESIREHQAPGELIVHCLEGRVSFTAMGKTIALKSGEMFYLAAAEPHAVSALEDCCFLLTILFDGGK